MSLHRRWNCNPKRCKRRNNRGVHAELHEIVARSAPPVSMRPGPPPLPPLISPILPSAVGAGGSPETLSLRLNLVPLIRTRLIYLIIRICFLPLLLPRLRGPLRKEQHLLRRLHRRLPLPRAPPPAARRAPLGCRDSSRVCVCVCFCVCVCGRLRILVACCIDAVNKHNREQPTSGLVITFRCHGEIFYGALFN